MTVLRIALLRIAPRAGDLAYNCRLVESGVIAAAAEGAEWIVTPELCLSGYEFSPSLGTDWIETSPDRHAEPFVHLSRRLGVTLFLSHAEKDPETRKLYNSTFVIGGNGRLLGEHRKLAVIPGIEAWSSPGFIRCGDVLLLDRVTPHRSLPVASGHARWAVVMWVKAI